MANPQLLGMTNIQYGFRVSGWVRDRNERDRKLVNVYNLPTGLTPRDPITERQRIIGVSNHLRNAKYKKVP